VWRAEGSGTVEPVEWGTEDSAGAAVKPGNQMPDRQYGKRAGQPTRTRVRL